MKTRLLTAIFMLFALSATTASADELTKHISHTYKVSGEVRLNVNAKYTNVTILPSPNANEIRIVAEVSAESNSEKNTRKVLDAIKVEHSLNGGTLDLRTTIDRTPEVQSRNFDIDCTIFIPRDYLPVLNLSYSDVEIKAPTRKELQLATAYGDVEIEIDLTSAIIKGQYSDVKARSIEKLVATMQYGDLEVDRVGTLEIGAQYSDVEIDELHRAVTRARYQYSDLRMGVMSTVTKLVAGVQYGDIIYDFKDFTPNLKGEVRLQYSDIHSPMALKYVTKNPNQGNNSFRGEIVVGNGAKDIEFSLEAQYSDVTIR